MNVFERLTRDSLKTHVPRGVVIPRPPHGLETMRKTSPMPLLPVLSARPIPRSQQRLSFAVSTFDEARSRHFVPEYSSDIELPFECPALPVRRPPVSTTKRPSSELTHLSRFDDAPTRREIMAMYRLGSAVKEEERKRREEAAVCVNGGPFHIEQLLAPSNPL